jgi:pimeloyl-ACP methyl ester carboxylesterase
MRLHSSPERMVFVHGAGVPGAAAWTNLHGMALEYDCLFVRRHGFASGAGAQSTDFAADMRIVLENLGSGGHVVAHAEGAVAAMMAAVERPDVVRTLTLFEPACLSLTADLPVTRAYLERRGPLFAARDRLDDEQYGREFSRLLGVDAAPAQTDSDRTAARRLRLQAPPWEAPLHIVPGLPTLVVTGGWEPLYEEVAEYLVSTGAIHRHAGGNHRPQDTAEGRALLTAFLRSGAGQVSRPGSPCAERAGSGGER